MSWLISPSIRRRKLFSVSLAFGNSVVTGYFRLPWMLQLSKRASKSSKYFTLFLKVTPDRVEGLEMWSAGSNRLLLSDGNFLWHALRVLWKEHIPYRQIGCNRTNVNGKPYYKKTIRQVWKWFERQTTVSLRQKSSWPANLCTGGF